jgi:hypothetical protein
VGLWVEPDKPSATTLTRQALPVGNRRPIAAVQLVDPPMAVRPSAAHHHTVGTDPPPTGTVGGLQNGITEEA